MPEITYQESCRQVSRLSRRAQEAEEAQQWAEAIGAVQRLLAHPCAHHQVWAPELWDQISQLHRRAGEFDTAIDAKRTAIREGLRSVPDPEADIAECHLLAGRRGEADRIFAVLRDRAPDDVWLYHAAGLAYANAGDHSEAERWLRDGIQVALRTGDPDQVVAQLADALDASLEALGADPDGALYDCVDAFLKAWQPVAKLRAVPELPELPELAEDEERACAHCGFDGAQSREELEERCSRARERILEREAPEALARLRALPNLGDEPGQRRLPQAIPLSFAWFPAAQWPVAVGRWPDLLDELPAEHLDYSHALEARIKRIALAIPGHRYHVSPLTVDGLIAYCAECGEDPGSGGARSSYAAEILRTGRALRWPPGRNEACWCGSGSKYKRCCGPIPPTPDDGTGSSP